MKFASLLIDMNFIGQAESLSSQRKIFFPFLLTPEEYASHSTGQGGQKRELADSINDSLNFSNLFLKGMPLFLCWRLSSKEKRQFISVYFASRTSPASGR